MIDIRIIIGIGIVVLFLLYFVSHKPSIVSSNNNTYDLHHTNDAILYLFFSFYDYFETNLLCAPLL